VVIASEQGSGVRFNRNPCTPTNGSGFGDGFSSFGGEGASVWALAFGCNCCGLRW